ncbi:DEAD/DEAH box helicase family protein [Saccharothrix syringae]|uniref:Adenylyl-sulfate kinase n=1 Tax=Saccharothrix syringae TaxID=103733 RepID=A0A5Q0H6K0_SACSY|nr:hypothetical protein [Saccharothrix syringae]QFZ21878.1 hypothetical protein EKG83_34740 [Saccharothrix syringae]
MTKVIWLLGPAGAGKSTVGWHVYRALDDAAYVDVDQLGLCHPVPPDDPDNHAVKAGTLGSLWSARVRGALVVAGGPDRRALVPAYTDRLPGADVAFCRLRADVDLLSARLLARGWPAHLVARATAVAAEMDRDDFAGPTVDTGGRAPAEAARLVLAGLR